MTYVRTAQNNKSVTCLRTQLFSLWQGGVLKVMENHIFLVFLKGWVLFPCFWKTEGVAYIRIA